MAFYFDQFEDRKPPPPLQHSAVRELVWQYLAVIMLALGGWYLSWRWLDSLNWHAPWFALPLVIAETGAYIGLLLYTFNLWQTRDPETAPSPATINDCLDQPEPYDRPINVDVFITTYNENPELVQLSIRDACALTYDHPFALNIHVLDDGNRPAMRQIAEAEGVNYIARTENIGFKAGNLRNALAQTSGDFILICDADTRLFPSIISNTLGYFRDPKMAWVQTPQWFYDISAGERLEAVLSRHAGRVGGSVARGLERMIGPVTVGADPFVNDPQMFYDIILRRRNRANAVFCCGAASIHRREAITETALRAYADAVERRAAAQSQTRSRSIMTSGGGVSSAARCSASLDEDYTPYKFHVSEDIYTSLALHGDRHGHWKSCYHPQVESKMLSPQDLMSWTVQRFKYAGGSLDILFHDNPLLKRGLSLPQRLMYASTFASYLGCLWNTIFLLAPIIYLATAIAPISAYTTDFIVHVLPFLLAMELASMVGTWGVSGYRSKRSYLAFFWINLRALATVARHQPIRFDVTPKERQAGRHLRLVWPHITIIALTLGSAIYAVTLTMINQGNYTITGLITNLFWGAANALALGGLVRAALVSGSALPKEPSPERRLPAWLRLKPIVTASIATASIAIAPAAEAASIFGNRDAATVGAKSERHPGRNGPLTERERKMAEAAWSYFVAHTDAKTGLANAVGAFPSTTMWDTAAYLSALVSARELEIIDKQEFDKRTIKLLATLRQLDLFRGELPNKVYHTGTGAKVAYNNAPGEVGYSGMDVGRLLVWLKIIEQRYAYLANAADNVALRWNFCNVVSDHGYLHSAGIDLKTGQTTRFREGRLGYEEYAAKGYGLWGFKTTRASRAYPFDIVEIDGVKVPYDARDPRTTGQSNYVLSEAYLLEGIELNFDRPEDKTSSVKVHTDGWRAEFSAHVFMAQQRRFERHGVLTARTEHQVEGAPYFVYDSVFADGYPWNTQDPKGATHPERAAIAVKAALGMWALYENPYTDELFAAVADVYAPGKGFDEGIYENGSGTIPLQTANNNGIILAALLYKVQGPILKRLNPSELLWDSAFKKDDDVRQSKCMPDERPLDDCVVCGTKEAPTMPAGIFQYCRRGSGRSRDDELETVAVSDCRTDPYEKKAAPSKLKRVSSGKIDCPPQPIAQTSIGSDRV